MFLFVSILVFAATAVFVVAMVTRLREKQNSELKERVGGVAGTGRSAVQAGIERDTRMSTIPVLDNLLHKLAVARRIELLLYQAGLSIRVGPFLLVIVAFALVAYFIAFAIFNKTLHALVFMGVGGLIPFFWVQQKKNRRMRSFSEEFPDTLDLLVSALRAGISFSGALQIVADESPQPVRSEFAIVVEEQALGLDLRQPLTNMDNR